jgi:glycosyltransferase involved in cell wall biosynthesis
MVAVADLLAVLPSTAFGGAEKHTLDLCDALAGAGVRASILTSSECLRLAQLRASAHGKIGEAIEWRDRETFETNVARQKQGVERALRGRRFDCALVCAPWPHYAFGLQQALSEQGLPHLSVAHLFPRPGTPEWRDLPETPGARSEPASAWAAVSWPIARRVERMFRLPPHSVPHIANGVDVAPLSADQRARMRRRARARLGLAPDRRIALFLGRLDAGKGANLLPRLTEALADLDALAICAGDGPLRDALAATEAAARGRLRLLGHVANVSEWLFAADLLLLPSRLEGHPLVFLEAAAHRCPVVATDAALECYGAEKHGLALIAPTDDAAALIAQARLALTDAGSVAQRVERAFATARRRDRAAMTGAYKSLLRKIVAGDRRLRAATCAMFDHEAGDAR